MDGRVELIDVDAFFSDLDGVVERNLDEFTDQLSRLSYVGATGDFSRSWVWLKEAGRWKVVNLASDSLQRLVGVSPGQAQRTNIDGLSDWVAAILGVSDPDRARGVAYRILAVHKRIGSIRWRTGQNFLLLSADGKTLASNSPAFAVAAKIAEESREIVAR